MYSCLGAISLLLFHCSDGVGGDDGGNEEGVELEGEVEDQVMEDTSSEKVRISDEVQGRVIICVV